MTGNLITLPDRNVFPTRKWTEYVSKIELLGNLRKTRWELDRSVRLLEKDVDSLRRELVDAVRGGAAIENAGRIAG